MSRIRNPFPVAKSKSTKEGVEKDAWVVGTWDGPAMWVFYSRDEAVEMSKHAFKCLGGKKKG